jgi:hypothetical protein
VECSRVAIVNLESLRERSALTGLHELTELGCAMVLGDWIAGRNAGERAGEADARAGRPYNPQPPIGPFDSDDWERGYRDGYETGYRNR